MHFVDVFHLLIQEFKYKIKMLPPNLVVRRKLSPKEETVTSILEVSLFRLHIHIILYEAF